MRKSKEIVLEDRGNKLTFYIEEMPATQLESWIMRAFTVLAGAGADVPFLKTYAQGAGKEQPQGNADEEPATWLQALARVDYDKAKPLLDELFSCVWKVNGAARERMDDTALVNATIEDVRTLFALRLEVLKLNFGFFTAAVK